MMNKENSYRNIIKGTSLFGGFQMLQIAINLVRGKFAALLLGPEGMGLYSLFSSSTTTLTQISSLGLNLAIVREVADTKRATVIFVARRLILFASILGAILCAIFSAPLSKITFGTTDYQWQFVALSLFVFFMTMGNGASSILQGLHSIKRLSRASLIGSLTGLLIGVPLYWLYGTAGIVPAIISMSIVAFIFYEWNLRHEYKETISTISKENFIEIAKRLLSLGMILMISSLLTSLAIYLLNIIIRQLSSTETVGLFQAANSLTNQYSTLIFTTLAMDYMPRLSALTREHEESNLTINRQIEIDSLITAPLVALLILTAPIVINLLLSSEFLQIVELVRWLGFGILLKAISYPLGYISFAKGDKKIFLWFEGVLGNLLYLIMASAGFYIYGLIGLGYAIVIENFIYLLLILALAYYRYNFRLNHKTAKQALIAGIIAATAFAASMIKISIISYIVIIIITAFSIVYSIIYIRRLL